MKLDGRCAICPPPDRKLRRTRPCLSNFGFCQRRFGSNSFTAADLAAESGVGLETVRKTLARLRHLFPQQDVAPSGRRGGQPFRYSLDRVAARPVLQREADQRILEEEGTTADDISLALTLAEDALLKVLPRAAPAEQRNVLSAARSHLALVSKAGDPAATFKLQRLLDALSTLIDTRDWLEALPRQFSAGKSRGEALAALRTVITARDPRSVERYTNGKVDQLVSFETNIGRALAGSAPLMLRPAAIFHAYWAVVSHPLWDTALAAAVDWTALTRAQGQLDRPTPRRTYVIAQAPGAVPGRSLPWIRGPIDINAADAFPASDKVAWFRPWPEETLPARAVRMQPEEPASIIKVACSPQFEIRARPTLPGSTESDAPIGKMVGFDLDLTGRRIAGMKAQLAGLVAPTDLSFGDLELDAALFGDRRLPSFWSAAPLEMKPSSYIGGFLIARTAAPEWIEPEIVRLRFPAAFRFDVHQVQTLDPHEMVLGFEGHGERVGQLIDMDVNLRSGAIRHGHIRIDQTLATMTMTANALEFLPLEQIFLLRSGVETSAPPFPYSGDQESQSPPAPSIRERH